MMDNTQKNAENPQVLIMEDSPENAILPEQVEQLVPNMNVSVPEPNKDSALISDDQYLGVLDEIMGNIRDDRRDVSEYIDKFADLVINDGDATTSSKEALINLIKVKVDLQDKMLKAADLMTRLKLKNAFAYSGPHLNAMQQNNFNIGTDNTNFDRKEIIRAINHAKKKKDEK
jgi:hypothetical protein